MKFKDLLVESELRSKFDIVGIRSLIKSVEKDIDDAKKTNPRAVRTYEDDISSYEMIIDYVTDRKGPFIDLIRDTLRNLDTQPRDEILKYIDKSIWKQLGFNPL